jgi:glycosyltransferase involved in cell wall biosynthesis
VTAASSLRIGISALYQASGGSLTNLAQLLRVWSEDGTFDRHDVILFASGRTRDALEREAGAEVLRRVSMRIMAGADRGLLRRMWAEQIGILSLLRAERIDVLFCPGNVIPFAANVPTVAVFQNAAPFCESVTFRSLRGQRWLHFLLLGRLVRLTARRATRVIFISNFFRDLFVDRFRFSRERGAVIPRAAGRSAAALRDAALEDSLGIRAPYVLSVSNVNPYKNLVELIDGFAAAVNVAADGRHQLVIAGLVNFPWYLERMQEAVRRAGLQDRVVFTGDLPHKSIESLLAGCESFVFSSTCENCPTALIEALSFGLPVASSNVGVMPEIGGDAVRYFDPYSVPSVRDALLALMTDAALRSSLAERALERAATFPTAAGVARRTLAVLESAAGGR